MKILGALFTVRNSLILIASLSGAALFSSFYLQYASGYQPCFYCYVLRYLTLGILGLSVAGLAFRYLASDLSAALAGMSFVGTGVSGYLILDELFPSSEICTACSFSPLILGISLYYYSLAFTTIVVGLSLGILLGKPGQAEPT